MITDKIAPMLTGEELKKEMAYLPTYNEDIRMESPSVRLMELNNLYDLYIPSKMSEEIYSKLYLAMLRSLHKKEDYKLVTQQRNENAKRIRLSQSCGGIIGGSDSFTIIGESGIGKSSAIARAVSVMEGDSVIEMEKPYCKIIPVVSIQCPFDCSVKGMLLQILKEVDEVIATHHYELAVKSRATTDMLIGNVSQVALNHIGLLIVDEIQNVVNHKQGRSLVGCLTQLINNSGISICMVGTPETASFFETEEFLARRALGLRYDRMEYGTSFREFCKILFRYQYVVNHSDLTGGMVQWLFEHSGGVPAAVVTLLHDAQEIGILNGSERLDIAALNEAYEQRMGMLSSYIRPTVKIKSAGKRKKDCIIPKETDSFVSEETKHNASDSTIVDAETSPVNRNNSDWTFMELAELSKKEHVDMVELLKGRISITAV